MTPLFTGFAPYEFGTGGLSGYSLMQVETKTEVTQPVSFRVTYGFVGEATAIEAKPKRPLFLGFRPTWLKGSRRRRIVSLPWWLWIGLGVVAGIVLETFTGA